MNTLDILHSHAGQPDRIILGWAVAHALEAANVQLAQARKRGRTLKDNCVTDVTDKSLDSLRR